MTQIVTVDDLLRLDGEAFVERAYVSIMGRAPDDDGRNHFLSWLRRGIAKERLLMQLCSSPEGRKAGHNLPGLYRAVWRYRLGQLPILGVLFRVLFDIEGNSLRDRQIRSLRFEMAELREMLETGSTRSSLLTDSDTCREVGPRARDILARLG